MERKVQQRTIENREKLLSASQECFSKYGYHNTNIREITKIAGLSTGVFYRYFENKDSLFLTLVEQYFEESLAYMREMLSIREKFPNKAEAKAILLPIIQETLSRSNENKVFLTDATIIEKDIPELYAIRKKGILAIDNCIEEYLKKYYPNSNMDYKITAHLINTTTDAIGKDISNSSYGYDNQKYCEIFVDYILYFAYDLV